MPNYQYFGTELIYRNLQIKSLYQPVAFIYKLRNADTICILECFNNQLF